MKLAGHDATRIHGSLTVTLSDGREASLDIDIDVSDDRAFVELENHYYNDDDLFRPRGSRRLESQSLSFRWPASSHLLRGEAVPPPLVIRVPVDVRDG